MKELPNYKEIISDLKKWSDKVNAMMLASTEGNTPQALKMLLMKKMTDGWYEMASEGINGRDGLKQGEKFIDCFLTTFGKLIKTTSREEAKKRTRVYEVEK